MKLNPKLAQEIIDYTAGIVKYIVNIMDTDAVIIASTDPARIGEVHLAAKQVLSSGEAFIMDAEFSGKNPSYIPGINLPIKFRGEIIGVLGVGAGDESRLIGGILLSTTELLIEQSYLINEMNIEKQVKTEFLSHLLTESWHDNEKYFKRQIELHSFDISQGSLVIAVDIPDNVFSDSRGNNKETKIAVYDRLLNSLTDRITTLVSPYRPIVLLQPGQIVVLLHASPQEVSDANLYIPAFVEKLSEAMDKLIEGTWRIGIGGYAANMTEIHKYYKHAVYALKIAAILVPEEQITAFRSFYTEYELLALPKYKQEHFYKAVLGELLAPENQLWFETLDSFFKHDKSIADTADSLFIHRNTLMFRLHKIEKFTGLNPQHFKDSITLNSAITLWKLRDFDDSPEQLLL